MRRSAEASRSRAAQEPGASCTASSAAATASSWRPSRSRARLASRWLQSASGVMLIARRAASSAASGWSWASRAAATMHQARGSSRSVGGGTKGSPFPGSGPSPAHPTVAMVGRDPGLPRAGNTPLSLRGARDTRFTCTSPHSPRRAGGPRRQRRIARKNTEHPTGTPGERAQWPCQGHRSRVRRRPSRPRGRGRRGDGRAGRQGAPATVVAAGVRRASGGPGRRTRHLGIPCDRHSTTPRSWWREQASEGSSSPTAGRSWRRG